MLTMRQVRENVNRMLIKEVFVEVAALTGKPFDIDACCDDDGVNSHCASYCSPSSSFLKRDVSGQHVWMNVPTNRIELFIRHYLKCKARAPQSTSACVVVPCWQGPWRKLLTGMRLLKSYEQGSTLFTAPRRGSNCAPHEPAPWVVEIWYDVPAPAVQVNSVSSDAYELLFTFPGLVAGVPARIAVDNCATHNFCDHVFAVKQGLDVQPCNGSVVCAGTESVPIKGCVHVRVQIQSMSQVVKLLVIDLTGDKLHAKLGQSWLVEHGAVISFRDKVVRYLNGGRRAQLKCVPPGTKCTPPALPCLSPPLLTHVQLKTLSCDKRNDLFTVHVSAVDESSPVTNGKDVPAVTKEFSDVFAERPPGLPPDRGVGHTINLSDSSPVSKPMYRLSPKEQQEVTRQVKDLLARGLIQPSHSAYSSPVIFVRKKSGELRMCVDYRALNQKTVKDKYPLPRIDDLLDRLQGASVFSSLDLQSGYHQIRIASEDVPKTAFSTPLGLFEFCVLPFGLTNAPAAFQREMNRVFKGLDFVLVYLDDILVFSKSELEHEQHLRVVLELLRTEKLYAKMSKCSFCASSVEFLGHVVSSDGVHVDPKKIAVIAKWPLPKSPIEVRSFLGLGNYFKRFIQGYSKLVHPLVQLTKPKLPFVWSRLVQSAFDNLKHCLCDAPVLVLPDFDAHYEVVCDASGFGCGAVLPQNQKPIAFHSYKLSDAERRYPAGEQELLAVISALRQWRCYLEGATGGVTVVTDHKPNTFLDTKPAVQLSSRQVHWQQFLSRFDFQWEYRKGCCNVADLISRCPSLHAVAADPDSGSDADVTGSVNVSGQFLQHIRDGYVHDPYFANEHNTSEYTFVGGYWRKGELIIVPDVHDLRRQCLSLHHDTPYAGHLGRDRTAHLVQQTYWWPGLDGDVRQFVSTCDFCQKNKTSNQKPAGLLQPLTIPEFRWASVSVDFITQLPETAAGHSAIVVFVDRLSKMVHLAPCWNTLGAQEFSQIFVRDIFAKHGLPQEIVSDRGAQFTSKFFREVSKLLGVKQCLSSSHHPQSDGQTERANCTLEDMLRCALHRMIGM